MSLQGHDSFIKAVSYSPDGKTLASAGLDQKVILWDSATGKQLRTFTGQNGMILCLDWSHDGSRIATGGDAIVIWDVSSGEPLRTVRSLYGLVNGVSFSPDGKHLATAQYDQAVLLFYKMP
jgi:WD40 repeat protein